MADPEVKPLPQMPPRKPPVTMPQRARPQMPARKPPVTMPQAPVPRSLLRDKDDAAPGLTVAIKEPDAGVGFRETGTVDPAAFSLPEEVTEHLRAERPHGSTILRGEIVIPYTKTRQGDEGVDLREMISVITKSRVKKRVAELGTTSIELNARSPEAYRELHKESQRYAADLVKQAVTTSNFPWVFEPTTSGIIRGAQAALPTGLESIGAVLTAALVPATMVYEDSVSGSLGIPTASATELVGRGQDVRQTQEHAVWRVA